MGSALNVSQTMGSIQHIMIVMNSLSETFGELFGGVGRILWGRVAFRDRVPAEIRTMDEPNKYK